MQHVSERKIVSNTRLVAAVAAAGFVLVAGYQVSLALGVPLGAAAWGGVHEVLPRGLRIASAISAVVLLVAALTVLGRAGYWGADIPYGIFHWGTWVFAVLMALSGVANLASSSLWERYLLGPIAFLLAILCLLIVRSEMLERGPTE